MSKIEITSSNIDKFVKRFHKISEAKDSGKKLSESQETFAQSLGCNNYNELKTLLEKENKQEDKKNILCSYNTLCKGFIIDNAESLEIPDFIIQLRLLSNVSNMSRVELFYNQLLTLINHKNSKISSCLFKKDGFKYSIELKTYYGDEYKYLFGEAVGNLDNILTNRGFSILDVKLIASILSNDSINEIKLENRFEAIDFAHELYNYLLISRGKKIVYVLKFNEEDNINKNYVFKHDLLYTKEVSYIRESHYEELLTLIINHDDSEYYKVKNTVYLTNVSFSNEIGNIPIYYLKSISDFSVVVKKDDLHK
jgi:hypothetical protein